MAKVEVHVYDLSNGLARVMSQSVVGKQVDIIPHTGVVVDWGGSKRIEYFFGGGICVTPAGQSVPMAACEVLDFGTTAKTEAELLSFLREASPRFTASTYDLLTHNCNHFSNEVATYLTGRPVPERILNVANEALSTPQGQALRGMLEGFQTSINQSNSGNALNPLGGAPAAALASAAPPPTAAAPVPAAPAAAPPAPSQADETAAALREVTAADTEAARACLTTLRKVALNLLEHPADDKYRRIKLANPAFNKKVMECPGGTDLFLCLGFCPDTIDGVDFWVWGGGADAAAGLDEPLQAARVFEAQLAASLQRLPPPPQPPAPAPAPAAPVPPAPPGGLGGFGGLGGMGGGLPAGMNPAMMQQMATMMQQNPGMMQQAQQMMSQNPQAMQRTPSGGSNRGRADSRLLRPSHGLVRAP